MSEEDVVWEDPPVPIEAKPRRQSKYLNLARELKKNPDKWALAATGMTRQGAKQLTTKFKLGQYGSGIDASNVLVADDRRGWNVYARYVPKSARQRDRS